MMPGLRVTLMHAAMTVTLALATLTAPSVALANQAKDCSRIIDNRRISIVVGHPPGGGFDAYARALAPVLQRTLGTRVVVTNTSDRAAGIRAVGEVDSRTIRIGVSEAATLVQMHLTGAGVDMERLEMVGIVTSEAQAWSGRPGTRLADFGPGRPLIAAVSTAAASVIEIGLPSEMLGIPFRFVAGYPGTQDRMSAVLRGEADIASSSLGSTLQMLRGGDFEAVLVLSDQPHPAMPGTPYLAGEGGVIDQMTRGRPEGERRAMLEQAADMLLMADTVRALFIAKGLPDALRGCIGEGVDRALFDPEFAAAAKAMGRTVAPRDGASTREFVARLRRASESSQQTIRSLLEQAVR